MIFMNLETNMILMMRHSNYSDIDDFHYDLLEEDKKDLKLGKLYNKANNLLKELNEFEEDNELEL